MNFFDIIKSRGDIPTVEFLDSTVFDEKIEFNPAKDTVKNLFHTHNKYHVPVMKGSYRIMYDYSLEYMIHPDDREKYEIFNPDFILERMSNPENNGIASFEVRQKMIDGSYRWVRYICIYGIENGAPEGCVIAYVYDAQSIHDRKDGISEGQTYESNRNSLTGLLTRDGFFEKAIEKINADERELCCVSFDIQHFNIFNAWYGHEKGDYVLARIGSVLRVVEEKEDTACGYFGKDTFAFVIDNDIKKITEIYEAVKDVIFRYSKTVGFLPAFGVCVKDKNDNKYIEIYDRARYAATIAKKSYQERIVYFDESLYSRQRDEYNLITDFQDALKNDELNFYLQPIVETETGKIVGAEALARWIKQDGTVIGPGSFIPFLEQNGFMPGLDKVIWEKAVKWVREIIDKNIRPVPVSLNVSQIDILTLDIPSYFYALIERYNIPAKYIRIEITESSYAEDYEKIDDVIKKLKKRGFTVLIDDFGTGYSSLSMIDKVNADAIKLDMDFMKKRALTKKTTGIIEATFSMLRIMGIPLVVEGVETEKQVKFLKNLGCNLAQGYHFYKPMPAERFEKLLRDPAKVSYTKTIVRDDLLFHSKELLNEFGFSDVMLNNILGPVAIYTESKTGELNIERYNKQFCDIVDDVRIDSRRTNIAEYVHPEDRKILKNMLKDAYRNRIEGGECNVRIQRSSGGWYWYNMHLFFINEKDGVRRYYGKSAHISGMRRQGVHLYEMMKRSSDRCLRIDLNSGLLYELSREMPFDDPHARSMDARLSLKKTRDVHISDREQKENFLKFFSIDRLRNAQSGGIYSEGIKVDFKLGNITSKTNFMVYYIKFVPGQENNAYIFVTQE